MPRVALGLLIVCGSGARAIAQGTVPADSSIGRCARPDSIAVTGNQRVTDAEVRAALGLSVGEAVSARALQDGVKALFNTGQFDDVQVTCNVAPAAAGAVRASLVVQLKERPVLGTLRVAGAHRIAEKTVRERIDLTPGRPIPPGEVARAVTRIDSLYTTAGYFLASVTPESTTVAGRTDLTFRIDEAGRLSVSGIRLHGNTHVGAKAIVGAMKTKPEGFWWFRKGEFDRDVFASDLGDRLPEFYARQGFIDFQVVRDTLIIDRVHGKALIDLTVNEGPEYHVGTFDVLGNHHFTTEELQTFYPFGGPAPTFAARASRFLMRRHSTPVGVFDRARWDDATQKLRNAYANEGYIYATVQPVTDRVVTPDSQHVVNLRWEIVEKTPAIVNRIEITGNDYTAENCIRDAIVLPPGGVFSQDLLLRSYQSLSNLGFFETPI